jgi:hypothetical protein
LLLALSLLLLLLLAAPWRLGSAFAKGVADAIADPSAVAVAAVAAVAVAVVAAVAAVAASKRRARPANSPASDNRAVGYGILKMVCVAVSRVRVCCCNLQRS